MTDFLLQESPMGYALFKVKHQQDTVGNRLKEVQDATTDLAKFGKMVDVVSFLPFEYALTSWKLNNANSWQVWKTSSRRAA